MSESGLFSRWRSEYWPQPSNCSTGAIFTDVTTKPLVLEDIVSSLILYLLGTSLALLVFGLERLTRIGSGARKRRTAPEQAVRGTEKAVIKHSWVHPVPQQRHRH